VVVVQVAEHDEVQAAHVEGVEAACRGVALRAGVEQDGRARSAAQHDGGPLPDVAHDEGPSRWWPRSGEQPRGQVSRPRDCGEGERRREDRGGGPGTARVPRRTRGERRQDDRHRRERRCPARAAGPGQHRARQGGGAPRDRGDPLGEEACGVDEDRRAVGPPRPDERGEHAEHRRGRDGERREDVRGHRVRRHRRGEEDEDRRAGRLSRCGHGEGVREPPRQRPRPSTRPQRGEEHQRCRRRDGQDEAVGARDPRVGQDEHEDGRRQGGDGSARPAHDEPDDDHAAHRRGPQHARTRVDEDDEADQRHGGESCPQGRPQAAGDGEQCAEHDGDVRPGDGGDVRQRHRPHRSLEVARQP
jgi:hypothetical protein